MTFFSHLSIKKKFSYALVFAVLVSTMLVGAIGQWQSRSLVTERLENVELPNILKRIRNEIDKEISVLEQAAKQMAENPFVEQFMQQGHPPAQEAQVVELLQRTAAQYQLTNASVVNRQSAHYWNQDGFLRVLNNDELDGWFFAYRASGEVRSKSLYTLEEVPKIFINYQDVDGIVASGIARSLNDFVTLLQRNTIGERGFVFITDATGTVKLHNQKNLVEKASLSSLYGAEAGRELTRQTEFAILQTEVDGDAVYLASSYIPSADWYVVAQVPVADMFAALDAALISMLLQTLVIVAIFGALAFWLANRLSNPISQLAETFQRLGEAEATLDVRLEAQKEKELVALQAGFNRFIEKIKATIGQISETSSQLTKVSDTVSDEAQAALQLGQKQYSHTEDVTGAIEQLNASVHSIANNAHDAATTSEQLKQVSQHSGEVSGHAIRVMQDLTQQTQSMADAVRNLVSHTEAIEQVLNVIKGVSEQTNLLALNAAIEAARAGEQGRGFAVVADEVRALAQRTHDSTDEIGSTILRLQEEVKHAVNLMEQSESKAREGEQAVRENADALGKIAQRIDDVLDVNQQVAVTTQEQARVAEDIARNLASIRAETEAFLNSSSQVSESSAQLRALANQLDALARQYR